MNTRYFINNKFESSLRWKKALDYRLIRNFIFHGLVYSVGPYISSQGVWMKYDFLILYHTFWYASLDSYGNVSFKITSMPPWLYIATIIILCSSIISKHMIFVLFTFYWRVMETIGKASISPGTSFPLGVPHWHKRIGNKTFINYSPTYHTWKDLKNTTVELNILSRDIKYFSAVK